MKDHQQGWLCLKISFLLVQLYFEGSKPGLLQSILQRGKVFTCLAASGTSFHPSCRFFAKVLYPSNWLRRILLKWH